MQTSKWIWITLASPVLLGTPAFGQMVGLASPGPGTAHTTGGGGGGGAACTPASGYAHCRVLTISSGKATSDLTNFPVLVQLTLGPSKIQSASCFDVVFTSDSGGTAKVPWEQDGCVPGTGVYTAWVLPFATLHSGSDNLFYVSYGNSAVSTAQNTGGNAPANVWPSYLGVYHLPDGSSLAVTDSTGSGYNGTLAPATHAPTAASGNIDGGALFTAASSQYFTLPNTLNPNGTKTLSFWLRWTYLTGDVQQVMGLAGPTTTQDGFGIFADGGALIAIADGTDANGRQATTTFTNGAWYHVTIQKTTGQINKIYINGQDVTTPDMITHVYLNSATNVVGINNDLTDFPYGGVLDELRLFNGTLSAAWIAAEFNSQKSGSTFLTVGSEI